MNSSSMVSCWLSIPRSGSWSKRVSAAGREADDARLYSLHVPIHRNTVENELIKH
jgi:hypothetical protein